MLELGLQQQALKGLTQLAQPQFKQMLPLYLETMWAQHQLGDLLLQQPQMDRVQLEVVQGLEHHLDKVQVPQLQMQDQAHWLCLEMEMVLRWL